MAEAVQAVARPLADSVAERHAEAGEVAFLLEPDLKEGRGGLRDVHALGWAERARLVLLAGDRQALDRGLRRCCCRCGSSCTAAPRRPIDVLYLEEQDAVAEALG